MNTTHLIQQAGFWPVLCLLLPALLVAALRLLALPLAAAALADVASAPLSLPRKEGSR